MSIIAFNFSKIAGERKPGKNTDVKNQTQMTEVKEAPLGTQKALQFAFRNSVNYQPSGSSIIIEGDVLVLSNEKEAKDAVALWTKSKQLSPEMTQKVYNAVLSRSGIQALIMAKELNLSAPVQMPRVKPQQAQSIPAAAAAAKAPAAKKK